jgi:hypothetical protein
MELESVTSHPKCERLVSIETIADGSCLIHSILKGYHSAYQKSLEISFRVSMAKDYRRNMGDYILKPNILYETEEDTANLIRQEYHTEEPKKFMTFLRMMYNYTETYIDYPYEMEEFSKNGHRYSTNAYTLYLKEYKNYLKEFVNKINTQSKNSIKPPSVGSKRDIVDIITILPEIDTCKKYYNEVYSYIEDHIKRLKTILESIMGYKLYLPNYFNKGVIEYILSNCIENGNLHSLDLSLLPKGKYFELPYNCNLFTLCKASSLMKFEMEYNDFDEIVSLGDISNHFKSRRFIGDGDVLSFIPHILGINLIIISFENSCVISVYDNELSDKYVVVNNIRNVHFETVGIKGETSDTGLIKTLFDKNDNFIIELLKKSKTIDFDFIKDKPQENENELIQVYEKLKDKLSDEYELELKDNQIYIKYKINGKILYRFYVNDKCKIISGNVSIKIKNQIENN